MTPTNEDPYQKLLSESKKEKAMPNRLKRWFLFRFGFSQCRYCVHLSGTKFAGKDGKFHAEIRHSFLINEGTCKLALDSASRSTLDRKDIRDFKRCPAFTEAMYTFKGFELNHDKVKEIRGNRRTGWDAFLKWVGWIVALLAFFLSLLAFILQKTPTLTVQGASLSGDEKKLYLAINNVGEIPAYQINGNAAITSAVDNNNIASDEKVNSFGTINSFDEAFYPGTQSVIVVHLDAAHPVFTEKNHTYLSISFTYPRLILFSWEAPFRRGYQGIFYLNKESRQWALHSKTMLPDHFVWVFKALNRGVRPVFKLPDSYSPNGSSA